MDKWTQYLKEARDRRPQPERTPFKSNAQKQYKSLRRKNDIYSTVSGHKNLKTGAPFDGKVKRAGTDSLRFEEVDPESFEKQPELEPKFWVAGKLNPQIAKRLQKIAKRLNLQNRLVPRPRQLTDEVASVGPCELPKQTAGKQVCKANEA